MSDQKIGIAAILSGNLGVSFKCWKGDRDETMFMVLTSASHDSDDFVTLKVRVDKNTIREVAMKGKEAAGKQAYIAVGGVDDDVFGLIDEMKNAKQRLVLEVAGSQHTLSVKGAPKVMEKMTGVCSG